MYFRREWIEAYLLGEMTPRRFKSLQVKAKILFVMEQIAIGVPAQLPAVALPTTYLRYLDAVQFLSLNAAANAERMCLTRPDFFAQLLTATLIPIAAALVLLAYAAYLKAQERSWETAYSLFLLLTYCVFPAVSQTIFQVFACDTEFDDGATSVLPRGTFVDPGFAPRPS